MDPCALLADAETRPELNLEDYRAARLRLNRVSSYRAALYPASPREKI